MVEVINHIWKGEHCDPRASRSAASLSETQCTADTCLLLLIWGIYDNPNDTRKLHTGKNQRNNRSLYLREKVFFTLFFKQQTTWLAFAYLIRLSGITFSGLTRNQFKSVVQDSDETCQWYWYGSELFGIKVSSEWWVDGNYF